MFHDNFFMEQPYSFSSDETKILMPEPLHIPIFEPSSSRGKFDYIYTFYALLSCLLPTTYANQLSQPI